MGNKRKFVFVDFFLVVAIVVGNDDDGDIHSYLFSRTCVTLKKMAYWCLLL